MNAWTTRACQAVTAMSWLTSRRTAEITGHAAGVPARTAGPARSSWLRAAVGGAVLVVALGGCQVIEKEEAQSTEQLLAAAGFQMKPADTSERMAHLETLDQRTLVPHDQDGEVRYIYADARDCKCLYVGDQKAYDEYQKLLAQQRVADEAQQAATLSMGEPLMGSAMDWRLWGE